MDQYLAKAEELSYRLPAAKDTVYRALVSGMKEEDIILLANNGILWDAVIDMYQRLSDVDISKIEQLSNILNRIGNTKDGMG